MNLWAKSLGQFAFLAIALSFFSCEDDTIQGYKTNPKFKVSYKEIVLPSSVMLLDSIRTSNYYYPSETNRLLVGQYVDPVFGTVKAGFFGQVYPAQAVELADDSEYDSVTLNLAYDFYTYGSRSITSQTIGVYQLTENLYESNKVDYTNESSVSKSPFIMASKSFSISPSQFDQYLEDGKDTTITLSVKLPVGYGRGIFNVIKDYSTGGVDSAIFASKDEFLARFKGLAVTSESGDKIIRFNPASASTNVTLHYHTAEDTLKYSLTFANQVSFNQVSIDRSGSPLSSIEHKYSEYLADDPLRYVQAGSGLVTKIDLQPFIDFADANGNLLMNGVEIVIEGVDAPAEYAPPVALALRAVDNGSSRLKKYASNNPQDMKDVAAFGGYFLPDFQSTLTTSAIQIENDSVFYAVNDIGRSTALIYDKSTAGYNGFMTSFFQQLTYNDGRMRPTDFVLYPVPLGAKSVNRLVFPADKIKLKIYYTTPLQ